MGIRKLDYFALQLLVLLFVVFSGCGIIPDGTEVTRETALTHYESPVSAEESLRLLKEGNLRFISGNTGLKDAGEERREHLFIDGQKPFAVIVGCSDSRVPPEIIFDWSAGDLFIIRTAGNIVDPIALGSIEYALEHLNVPLVVILGHESCGAVKATIEAIQTNAGVSPNIDAIIKKIEPSVKKAEKSGVENSSLVELSTDKNIQAVAEELVSGSSLIARLVEDGEVSIVGAKYFLVTGEVHFFD